MTSLSALLLTVVSLTLLVVKSFALIDVIRRDQSIISFRSPLDKRTWLIILSLGLVAHLVWSNPLGLLNLAGTVAALVYLAQVRASR